MASEQKAVTSSAAELYQAILRRRSVRRYQREALSEKLLQNVKDISRSSISLIGTNQFYCDQKATRGINQTEVMGGYGRIVNPPHFLVPYLVGKENSLTDLGYRVEQIVIKLTALGLGTCYLGNIGRQELIKQTMSLPPDAVIGALVAFGQPTQSLGGRAVNTIMHNITGAENKLPIENIGFENTFDQPISHSSKLIPIIEAARRSPSAVNAQPWRLLADQNQLYLFIKRENSRYGSSQDYRYYDAGICMAHISLALQTLDKQTNWVLLDPGEKDIPHYPETLEPIARIEI